MKIQIIYQITNQDADLELINFCKSNEFKNKVYAHHINYVNDESIESLCNAFTQSVNIIIKNELLKINKAHTSTNKGE